MAPPPHLLDPAQLRTLALTLAEREHRELHWSVRATVLGRVQDEGLFRTPEYGGFATARAWAFETLHLPLARFRVLVDKFWPMLKRYRAEIPLPAWQQVPITRALPLAKVLAMPGVDARTWFAAAVNTPSEEFRRQVATLLQEPVWTTFRCRIPVTLEETIEHALLLAARRVLDTPEPDPGRVKDPDVKFRLLEHVMVLYAQVAHRDIAQPPEDPSRAIAALLGKLDEADKLTFNWLIQSARKVGDGFADAETAQDDPR
jgi:hypothetical protein